MLEQALWLLGNLAGEGATARDAVLAVDALAPLVRCLERHQVCCAVQWGSALRCWDCMLSLFVVHVFIIFFSCVVLAFDVAFVLMFCHCVAYDIIMCAVMA